MHGLPLVFWLRLRRVMYYNIAQIAMVVKTNFLFDLNIYLVKLKSLTCYLQIKSALFFDDLNFKKGRIPGEAGQVVQ